MLLRCRSEPTSELRGLDCVGMPYGSERDTINLDGSRYWGGAFRDYGKFGSYPAYDDMGDESWA